jgi:diaminopimelate decarboxylase
MIEMWRKHVFRSAIQKSFFSSHTDKAVRLPQGSKHKRLQNLRTDRFDLSVDLKQEDRAQCASWKAATIKTAISQGLVNENRPLAMFWSLDELKKGVIEVHEAFPGKHFLHTTALKANPLLGLIKHAVAYGLGCEAASLGELHQGLRATQPHRLVFDSPTKTRKELKFALDHGVNINVDNLQELATLAELKANLASVVSPSIPPLFGVRVNPEVGAGSILTHSTSVPWSKFGVGLVEHEQALLQAYTRFPWLNMIHCHTGSQGCSLELHAQGLRRAVDLALRINQRSGRQQITCLDIGGGLPVNFASEHHTPLFVHYAEILRKTVPEIFSGEFQVFLRLVTVTHYF